LKKWLIFAGALVIAALFAAFGRPEAPLPAPSVDAPTASAASAPSASAPPLREQLVGSVVCAECHRAQSDAHRESHHARALVKPSPEVVSRFKGGSFTSPLGHTTQFSVRAGEPVVTTPAPSGKLETYPVRYVAGVWPLEQYVVETERGKLQSLGVAWDTRAAEAGGSKWFHVYGAAGVAPHDSLFFTGSAQNWNHICADCHSTFVERRYDVGSDRFDSRWAELSVGCEACHGPGADHVRSARAGKPEPFAARLRRSEPWRPSVTGSPTPRPQDPAEVETCAPCHARRQPLKESFVASDAFLDSFEPDLLRPGRYYADGQVEGEVFEWGSFVQSRMFHAGVRCSDCHEPHSGKPLAQGNALCVRCHEPTRFDVQQHSHHSGSSAPACVDCHMPRHTFMQIHERRDHSLRIPRPDHSVAYGTPNACNQCHQKKSAAWASRWLAEWAPASQRRPHFVESLAKDRQGTLDAPRRLRELASSSPSPAIARATALERLGSYPSESTLRTLRTALNDSDSLVAYGAVRGAAQLPPAQRAALLVPALTHPTLAVRVAAGRALAGVPSAQVPAAARPALDRAFAEVEQAFELSASRPETHVEHSAFELARGKLPEAEQALKTALRLDRCSVEAHLNLAELGRQRKDEAAAEHALRDALTCNPRSAAAHHALGLWQVRHKQPRAALDSLRKAVELMPADPRFSYVLAVALANDGHRADAIQVLEASLRLRPNDALALQTLSTFLRSSSRPERADELQKQLTELSRD
jgi:Tfp pilus assembly protein PilF